MKADVLIGDAATAGWKPVRRAALAVVAVVCTVLLGIHATARDGWIPLLDSANLAFHEAIGAACGNALIARSYSQLLAYGLRLSHISLAYEALATGQPDTHKEDIGRDHLDMQRHLMAGDADAAEATARLHTERFRARVLVFLQANLAADMAF